MVRKWFVAVDFNGGEHRVSWTAFRRNRGLAVLVVNLYLFDKLRERIAELLETMLDCEIVLVWYDEDKDIVAVRELKTLRLTLKDLEYWWAMVIVENRLEIIAGPVVAIIRDPRLSLGLVKTRLRV